MNATLNIGQTIGDYRRSLDGYYVNFFILVSDKTFF